MTETIGFEEILLGFREIWDRKTQCFISAILFFLVGMIVTLPMSTQNTYEAESTVYSAVFGSYEASIDGTKAMLSYSDIVKSAKVCDRAASILSDGNITGMDISEMIHVSNNTNNVVMTILARSGNPQEAVDVANAVAQAFVIEIRTITGTDAIQLLDEAQEAEVSRNGTMTIWMIRAAAFLVGAFIAMAVVFFATLFSDKLRSLNQVELTGEPILGLVPLMFENSTTVKDK